ncbi:hypothetical protein [Terrabacter terrigena]|uniref:Uncharacterized protein n=1 Tax=Terrabacter terrigena TaxID=574718 RepID=A0ABW3MXP5_9MICO
MKRSTVITALLVVAVFSAAWGVTRLVAGSNTDSGTGSSESVAAPASAVARVSLPGNVPATGEPQLASLSMLHPRPGSAVQAPGPFDDRFTMTGLRFDGRSVSATATITTDVSDVLEFGALAGFYDTRGVLIGTARFEYHNDESAPRHEHAGPPSELEAVSIAVPKALRGRAVSAAVGVPVLVNE